MSSDSVRPNANSISVFKQKLESVDLTPFVLVACMCFTVVLFSFGGHWACVSIFMTCMSRLLAVSINRLGLSLVGSSNFAVRLLDQASQFD